MTMKNDELNKECIQNQSFVEKHVIYYGTVMKHATLTEKPKATTKPWFSRLQRHPARTRSGSILGHTHMLTYILTLDPQGASNFAYKLKRYNILFTYVKCILLMHTHTSTIIGIRLTLLLRCITEK